MDHDLLPTSRNATDIRRENVCQPGVRSAAASATKTIGQSVETQRDVADATEWVYREYCDETADRMSDDPFHVMESLVFAQVARNQSPAISLEFARDLLKQLGSPTLTIGDVWRVASKICTAVREYGVRARAPNWPKKLHAEMAPNAAIRVPSPDAGDADSDADPRKPLSPAQRALAKPGSSAKIRPPARKSVAARPPVPAEEEEEVGAASSHNDVLSLFRPLDAPPTLPTPTVAHMVPLANQPTTLHEPIVVVMMQNGVPTLMQCTPIDRAQPVAQTPRAVTPPPHDERKDRERDRAPSENARHAASSSSSSSSEAPPLHASRADVFKERDFRMTHHLVRTYERNGNNLSDIFKSIRADMVAWEEIDHVLAGDWRQLTLGIILARLSFERTSKTSRIALATIDYTADILLRYRVEGIHLAMPRHDDSPEMRGVARLANRTDCVFALVGILTLHLRWDLEMRRRERIAIKRILSEFACGPG